MFTAFLAAFGTAMSFASGIEGAYAARESAKAKMRSLELEKEWNVGVMERNKKDVYARNLMESYGSGIDSSTGSTRAIINQNQQTLQEEIDFRRKQYDVEIGNLRAQSKQKFLGIF